MTQQTRTNERRQRDDAPQVEAVRRELEERCEGRNGTALQEFASLFLRRAPEAFLRSRSVSDLTSATLGAFDFLDNAPPDEVHVSVFDPGPDHEGWDAPVTVVRANVSERPFVVDTIREYLHAQGLAIEHMVYPLIEVERDSQGRVLHVTEPGDDGSKEALVHCEVEQVTDAAMLDRIRGDLTRCLSDVVRATDDFEPMIGVVDSVVEELEGHRGDGSIPDDQLAEIQHFLEWLRDGGFVFLGYREYELQDDGGEKSIVVQRGSGLGLLRNEEESAFAEPVPLAELTVSQRELVEGGPVLIISKTNAESTVHRRARMDYVGVRKMDASGRTAGEHRFIGLFTSKAYSDAAENIPILRHKLGSILEDAAVTEGTHDYKAIITIFNSLPREELFVSSADEIAEDVRTVLTAYSTDDVTVTVREDPLHRGLSVMVIVPKDRFSGDVRREIEAALVDAFEADVLNYHLALGEGDQARLHFYLAASEDSLNRVDPADLEVTVGRLIRTWNDLVGEELEERRSPVEAQRLVREWADRLTAEYRAASDPKVAAADICMLDEMSADDEHIAVQLANPDGDSDQVGGVEGATQLKLFLRGERLVLSDFMPILDHLGLRVIAMQPFDVHGNGEPDATIYVFAVLDREGRRLDVRGRGELLSQTLLAARAGDAVSDPLNALVVLAGLHWREVDVLRGLAGYAFQVGAVPSRSALPSALTKYPGIARELFELFQTRFDPGAWDSVEQRIEAVDDVRTVFQASLRGVSLLSDDRALRRLEGLICSTQRTNYYQCGGRVPTHRSGGVPYVSYKLLVGDIKHSRPTELLYEVWVHSSRMEGIHLRGSTVARGGIRWSDRPDDFRTEVLGLVETQMIKNAVIVPGGSKGGFITRILPQDPEERMAEGRAQYQTLMRGLLDLTDNLVDGKTVRARVVAYDPPDPYLVVAADKGTATFSDLANSVAAEYDFWLGDAFASGGSQGYDHKAVAITARGGWECVKRHFREKGKDIQSEPFSVVGIGDMSGDVFGNGMLLSRQTRLIAAFDHRHIFIDPDPDLARSFAERERMFGLGRSSWDDYDRAALSEGGMIVARGAKEVELTAQARRALALSEEEADGLNGESLIRCVLRAPAELLWNGGIGTYVKATSESHGDAGDPTNDAVRIDASELRCEVVGEGGNLGFTQAARVEYALGGGRINTDALDNSGGVDMSDHEVNLKILMAPAVASGQMSETKRNDVLEELTESVVDLVLHNNRTQSLAVSLDRQRARESADDFRDFMFALEKAGYLDRVAEGLPSRDVLAERAELGQSMVRPELCVLLAYSKLGLKSELLAGSLPDDPVSESYLVGYFPPAAVVAAGQGTLGEHPLRREIVACGLTNDLVDLMGSTFVYRVRRDTGSSAAEVVRAWLVASRLADHRALLRQMEEQRSVLNARVVTRWLLGLARVLERATRWVLHNVDPDVSPAVVVERNLAGLAALREAFADVVAGEEKELFEARVNEIRDVGADDSFSTRLITLRFLDQLLEILEIARDTGMDAEATARAYYQASELFDIPWLRRRTFAAAGEGQWEHRAAQALSEDLSRAHRKLVVGVVSVGSVDDSEGTNYMSRLRPQDVERFRDILAELRDEEAVGLAAVSVAARELASVADRLGRGAAAERRR